MSIFFTADQHVGHDAIIALCGRPFRDAEHMNHEIRDRYNERVSPGDTVWWLGDAALGGITESLAFLSGFNGRKYLISGNHDRSFHDYDGGYADPARLQRWSDRYRDEAGFEGVVTGAGMLGRGAVPIRTRVGGAVVDLSHFPSTGEPVEGFSERHTAYRPRSGSHPVVHGHVHNRWKVRDIDRVRHVNVGVDVWGFRPVSADEVAACLASPPGAV